jgi:pyruvate/2-oxoglutarate dehydrogenase complex dihydrolipoamide acyltransferase (E2) component
MARILDKTDKGREEIASRKHGLAPRLRTLLVLIDGKHTQDDLLKQVGTLGLTEQSVSDLIEGGFISFHESTPPAAAATPAAPAPTPAPAPAAAPEASKASTAAPASTTADAPAAVNHADILPPGENQFHALYNFYTSTIKSTIGLRGYGLQLKVERAASIDDFRELRQAYVEAVLKSKGEEMAHSLRDRLDQLLYLGNVPADLDPIL